MHCRPIEELQCLVYEFGDIRTLGCILHKYSHLCIPAGYQNQFELIQVAASEVLGIDVNNGR